MNDVKSICSHLVNLSLREDISISNISLQKILYFSQGFYLAENAHPLFKDKIFAWEYGPVVKSVYHDFKHFGNNAIADLNKISFILGRDFLSKEKMMPAEVRSFTKDMWDLFKNYAPFELVEFTHIEGSPWYQIFQKYNGNLPKDIEIPQKDMETYFRNQFYA